MGTTTKKKPGSPKGQPKPLKRKLDPQFPQRLLAAMQMRGYGKADVPELARKIPCTRAALHGYLSGEKQTLDVHLFIDICGFLGADPYWLLYGDTRRARAQ